MDAGLVIKIVESGARCLRYIKAEGLVGKVRRRAALGYFELLHLDIVHRIRKLGDCLGRPEVDPDLVAETAIGLCSGCALLMGRVLEVEHNELHACLKVIVKGRDGIDRLHTWVRSEPGDGREVGRDGSPLEATTAWHVFSGTNDGRVKWPGLNCFCCNDLTQHAQEYDNGRRDWCDFYQSKLIFPIRYPAKRGAYEIIGFLEFDSKRNSFRGMPNAYDYVKKANEYRTILEKNAIFHVGAMMADTLSLCLRPFYEHLGTKGRGHLLNDVEKKLLNR